MKPNPWKEPWAHCLGNTAVAVEIALRWKGVCWGESEEGYGWGQWENICCKAWREVNFMIHYHSALPHPSPPLPTHSPSSTCPEYKSCKNFCNKGEPQSYIYFAPKDSETIGSGGTSEVFTGNIYEILDTYFMNIYFMHIALEKLPGAWYTSISCMASHCFARMKK